MKKIIFLLPVLFLLSCANITYIRTMPEVVKIKEGDTLKGTTPYYHCDRGIGAGGRTFTLQMEGYKDKTITIERTEFNILRLVFPPVLAWPWILTYKGEYFFELEKSEQLIKGAENKFPKQTEITKPDIPHSSSLGTQSNTPDSSEYAQKLRDLKKLKDEGLLTDKEYEQKRKAIVDGM